MAQNEFSISAALREIIGRKVNKLRREGRIPAVVYGSEIDSTNLSIDNAEFLKLYSQVGETAIFNLNIEGRKAPMNVYIKDIDVDMVNRRVLHVSFYRVSMKEEMDTEIPLALAGASAAEKEGGVIVQSIFEVPIRCLPADLPSEIKVDISTLVKIGDAIALKDLTMPQGVKLMKGDEELEQVIVSATAPATEEEEEKLEEEGAAELEEVETTEQGVEVKEEGEGKKEEKKEGGKGK